MPCSIRRSSRARRSDDEDHQEDVQVVSNKPSKKDQDICLYPRTGRRGAPQVFPRKLYQIMTESSEDVISWTTNGTSFIILDMDTFSEQILLNYFRHQKYSSFQRQLNLYGFHKISKGPETGAYAHDCFIRGKPELLTGVRRLPQRLSGSTKLQCNSLQKGNKLVLSSRSGNSLPKQKHTSALSRLTSCLSKSEETSDESGNSEWEDNDEPPPAPSFNHNISSVDSAISSDNDDDIASEFASYFDENEAIEELDQNDIVTVQPLPKECIIPSSSIATIEEGVNLMALDKLSPKIAFAKHTSVHIPESAKAWTVKVASKPLTPTESLTSLQWMIPILGRGGSSIRKTEDEEKLPTFLENEIISLEKQQPFSDSNRSKSFSIDSAIIQELSSPPAFSTRLSSVDWNMTEIDQFTNSELTSMFAQQDTETPPQPIQMER
mmetsp:Transcript_5417/g.6769  ORF Transcript_5417/g.6769 Transcript_5417/m.6769 type:complete len:436 (-) Transcript_5417:290-1597(-)